MLVDGNDRNTNVRSLLKQIAECGDDKLYDGMIDASYPKFLRKMFS